MVTTDRIDPDKDMPPAKIEPDASPPLADVQRLIAIKPGLGFGARLRAYVFAGILVTAPVSITFYLVWLFVRFVDSTVKPLIPDRFNPETYLPFALPGLGLVVVIIAMTLIGMLTAGFFGRLVVRFYEGLLARTPVLRGIYNAIKQITETVLAQKSDAFREAVLVEFPRRDVWAIGFLTGVTKGEVQDLTKRELLNVFLPTTPNPTSGYLVFVPKEDVIILRMSVEDALKMVISGGIVTPPQSGGGKPRPAIERPPQADLGKPLKA